MPHGVGSSSVIPGTIRMTGKARGKKKKINFDVQYKNIA